MLLLLTCEVFDTRAYGGGRSSEGCHRNSTTGDYHCHHASSRATGARQNSPADPFSSLNDNQPARPCGTRAFADCAEARAAGAAPVRHGEPSYGPHLDPRNGGIGCEPFLGR